MKIAAVQLRSEAFAPEHNRSRTLDLIAAAAADGADLVILPELAIPGYVLDAEGLAAAAEDVQGSTFAAWHAAARRLGIHVAGGFCEHDGGRLYNSAMLVAPSGLALHYRKLHLFDLEQTIFSPGDRGLPIAETPQGTVGLCVCYDLRFVEVLRALSLAGADVAAVPTAWVGGFDRRPRGADGLIAQARGAAVQANLDQIAVACASQAGVVAGVRFLGSSLIADPFGDIIAGPLDEDTEGIVAADITRERLAAAKERSARIRPRADRRTDVYGVALGGRVL